MSAYNELAAACQLSRTSIPIKSAPRKPGPHDPKRITLAMVRDSVIEARKKPNGGNL